MLAALIATRGMTPPSPPVPFYSNQLIAAINTFACITVNRRAAALTTSLPIQYQLNLSIPGAPSTFDLLNLYYARLISYQAGDNPVFLSQTIGQIVAVVITLTGLLQTMPVLPSDVVGLLRLQQQLAISLAVLKSLGVRIN